MFDRLGVKLRSRGRGAHYSLGRGVIETALEVLFYGGWPARLWARVPGATRVRLVERSLPILPSGSPPLRVGFVSDIHIGPTTPRETLDAAFGLLHEAAPDVLLLGGDYVFMQVTEGKARRLAELVDRVPARTKLAVLGNHDLWDRHELLEAALREHGVRVLVNEAVCLPRPHQRVAIVGLDDPWTGVPDPDAAFSRCSDAQTRVVLSHAPEAIPLLRGREAALVVCGHTHGGQISLPSRPLYVNGHVGKRHWAGFHEVDGATVFVSRGIGGIEVPVRFNAAPDVALLTLVAGEKTDSRLMSSE